MREIIMDNDLEVLVSQFPELEVIKGAKRIRCTLSGHDFPYKAKEILNYTSGKKFKKLKEDAAFPFDSYAPFIIPSEKIKGYLFCRLTGKTLNRIPKQLENHVKELNYRYQKCQYGLGKKTLIDEIKKKSDNNDKKNKDVISNEEEKDVVMEDNEEEDRVMDDSVNITMEEEPTVDNEPKTDERKRKRIETPQNSLSSKKMKLLKKKRRSLTKRRIVID